MTGSVEDPDPTAGRLAALLIDASTEAISAAGGHAGGVYLRSRTPGLLRLAALSGLPGPLFRPWWRLHSDRPFPVADAYRLGVQVVLPNATETMRRYPQFAAGLPFQFGSLYVPVVGGSTTYGVLTVLRPAVADAAEVMSEHDRVVRLAQELGAALRALEDANPDQVAWDGEPVCLRPPTASASLGRAGRFAWDPETADITLDEDLHTLLGVPPSEFPGTVEAFAEAVAPSDAHRILATLRDTAAGRPPALPLYLRAEDGALRLLDLWNAYEPPAAPAVRGVVVAPGPGPTADSAADLLPDGVFCVDRLGLVVYANPRAAQLLGRPRAELVGRDLWEAVPWLGRPDFEDHLRAALLTPDPVHFHLVRPPAQESETRPAAQGTGSPLSAQGTGSPLAAQDAGSPLAAQDAGSPLAARDAGSPLSARDAGSRLATQDAGSPRSAQDTRPPPSAQDAESAQPPYEGDLLALSVHPGPDRLTCTVRPASRVKDSPEGQETAELSETGMSALAPLYRPIALAIALTEAVTARQVSAVVMRELLPAFGGRRLAIYLLQERHLYLEWETGFPKGFLAPFEGVDLGTHLPGVETLTTGRPLFFDSMEQLTAAYPGIPLDATEGARAFLPLISSGRAVGSCILGFDRPRSFSTEERTVLTALAGLIAHAMEKAQRYESETALARGLQQALLPRRLAAHPQLETTGRYLPGTAGMEVGGDWYDVVESGDGLALVIGDVQGHGVQAAATMGQLRSAVRAFALGDRPPDEVMSSTNHLLTDLDPGLFASCCYIRLDPATGVARAARAGHPPPLLRSPDGRTRVLDLPGGVVLGVDPRARYPVTELRMEPGAILALYTDGLVERPGSDIDEGITALRVALAKAGAPAARPGGRFLAGVADRLTATARHALDRPDDIALLLATRRAAPPPQPH
ncbi:serine phosphatase RsbU (regulator of sigma subunit)/PAS domain-containing protein [Streptomyces sp. SAI-144]|uniref:SpoIIE family protein phosphatase n=1 Tax=Streptomyces sp. SAI-144 TaxID=2940544 RepID=UPI0024750D13|nr:SpoIIE family protein phosphatase [Streptomyces sp. SAI-144]MDH6437718.1 serine phosphatase RsbU (regulator of sigma subunit)/PAS domain-containing protein [Streptomyces sp. SAI-144]